jgi:hypothetical protein
MFWWLKDEVELGYADGIMKTGLEDLQWTRRTLPAARRTTKKSQLEGDTSALSVEITYTIGQPAVGNAESAH